ncbi:hypothetical protein IZY60_12560 [Lutibacter sp. B2]|nr:hypothetical protein [Lutibacter sp. B2]
MEDKIKIPSILKSAFLLYKKHVVLLLSLSFSQYALKYIKFHSSQSLNHSALLEITFSVFDAWISIAFIIVISKLYKKEPCNFDEIFTWVRKKFWISFGINMVVGVIVLLAAIPNMIVLFAVDHLMIKIILTILFAPIPIYFLTIYNFSSVIAVLKESDHYLDESAQLVKQNFWKVLALLSISFLIDVPAIIKGVLAYKAIDINTMENIISFKFIIKHILFAPFFCIINIHLYYLLTGEKKDPIMEEQ